MLLTILMCVGGVTYDCKSDANGVAYLPIHLANKTYSITLKFIGDKGYKPVSKTVQFKVTRTNAKLSTSGLKAQYNSKKAIEVKVVNSKNNKPLHGVKVAFKVYTGSNFKIYYAETNDNGVARFYATKLSLGKHNVEIYSGIKYVTATTIKSTIEITKATTTVSAPKVTNTYQKNQYFKTTVKHKITGLTLPDINLNLKIYTGTEYKTYSVTTNTDGVASFNTKNLSVGTHKVVIESANSKYTISTTSSITIKK